VLLDMMAFPIPEYQAACTISCWLREVAGNEIVVEEEAPSSSSFLVLEPSTGYCMHPKQLQLQQPRPQTLIWKTRASQKEWMDTDDDIELEKVRADDPSNA
jgi:hypothetical protein